MTTELEIDFEQEIDGRWIAKAVDLPGVLAYGFTQDEAQLKVEELAKQVVSDPGSIE